MRGTSLFIFTLVLGSTGIARAQDDGTTGSAQLAALKEQNAILEKRIKVLSEQQRDKTSEPDPLAAQSELIERRLRLLLEEQTVLRQSNTRSSPANATSPSSHRDTILIESAQKAYTALISLAPTVAREFDCGGKNLVLYRPSQSKDLIAIKVFNDQLDLLASRLKMVLDIAAPLAPDRDGAGAGVYGVAALSGPVLQSVLDLLSLFHANNTAPLDQRGGDEKGLVAIIANAATAEGCKVYLPDQYAPNPFNSSSKIMAKLRSIEDLADNNGAAGKSSGLQQRIRDLRIELKRSQGMSEALSQKIEGEQAELSSGLQRVDFLKGRIDWISQHIKDEKNASLQSKLNRTFDKSWDDLDTAVKRQLQSTLPQTMEEQNRVSEMLKRLDLLKSRTDWLAQYVKDEVDLALQDKLKRILSTTWDDLEMAVKKLEALVISVPKEIEVSQREQRRWDQYSADLKDLITTTTAAAEAYTTFRGALFDASSGSSPLSRMLRAETLSDLTFDDNFQERPGASVVELTLEDLAGTYSEQRQDYSGGVVLSYVQYEPTGKLKKSAVYTVYSGFKGKL